MLNTSVMYFNSTSVPFNIWSCLNCTYWGMAVGYAVISFTVIVGTPAHFWLLWLALRAGWNIKPTQMFPLNLIILELIFCIPCAINMFSLLFSFTATLWRVSFAVFGVCWVGRPLMQVCICVEQYLAVLHPIIFLKYKALQYRIVLAAVVWLMAAGYAVFEVYADTFPDPIFNSIFFIAIFVISFCCVSVLRALKQPGPGDTQIPMERGRDVGNQQKRNAFNTIFSGLLIILFTYLPQVSLTLFNVIQTDKEMFQCNIVPFMNSFIVGVTITPLLKIYKNWRRKFLKHQRENKDN